MQIIYNFQGLAESFNHLENLLGISVGFMDATETWRNRSSKRMEDGEFCNMLTKEPEFQARCIACERELLEKCKKSGEVEWQVCYAGLYDGMMPVKKDGIIVGYLSFGQIRSDDTAYSLEIEDEALRKAYNEKPYFSKERMESLAKIIPQILFFDSIQFEEDADVIQLVASYIAKNLHGDLRVNTLCEFFHISKNSLYKGFRQTFHKGVNEYIIMCRINAAKKLLRESKDSIYMVAAKVGINSCSYFSRIFNEQVGMTPNQYRKRTS